MTSSHLECMSTTTRNICPSEGPAKCEFTAILLYDRHYGGCPITELGRSLSPEGGTLFQFPPSVLKHTQLHVFWAVDQVSVSVRLQIPSMLLNTSAWQFRTFSRVSLAFFPILTISISCQSNLMFLSHSRANSGGDFCYTT